MTERDTVSKKKEKGTCYPRLLTSSYQKNHPTKHALHNADCQRGRCQQDAPTYLCMAVPGCGYQRPGHLKAPSSPSPLSPDLGQVHGPLLRLNQVSPADSGEYSCQVTGSSGTLEASVLVTIEPSSPGPIPGE